ncbi:MAG: penicillin-insensitive murein endopeptidase [Thermodesulforhabdaceae bacterium]
MHRQTGFRIKKLWRMLFFSLCFLWVFCPLSHAMTRSIGYPFEGRLENGIPFPREFRGYQLRTIDHTYTTPELIGALLDAIDGVRRDFPDTCDLYLGDFSKSGGGPWYPVHKSHQNGRDVDIGMYAKGNIPLNGFVPMNEENLDLPKNWSLVLHLLNSHLVERIFVDASIQRLLYNYALSQGYDKNFLDKVFQVGSGGYEYTFVRHEPNHRDHMHVRFVAPWSELAGRIDYPTSEQRRVIELAQNSFLPKKVLYYAKDEASLEVLSSKLGIPVEDLLRWNKLQRLDVIRPGMPIVFYKRGFDIESVQLAMSLDAMLMRSRIQDDLAMLHNDVVLNIPPMGQRLIARLEEKSRQDQPKPQALSLAITRENDQTRKSVMSISQSTKFHVVKSGETPAVIAKKYNLDLKELLALNKLTTKSTLKPGQRLVVYSISKKNSLSSASAKTGATVRLAMVPKGLNNKQPQGDKKNTSTSSFEKVNSKASHQKSSSNTKSTVANGNSNMKTSSSSSAKKIDSANSKTQKPQEQKSVGVGVKGDGAKKVTLASDTSKTKQANAKNAPRKK